MNKIKKYSILIIIALFWAFGSSAVDFFTIGEVMEYVGKHASANVASRVQPIVTLGFEEKGSFSDAELDQLIEIERGAGIKKEKEKTESDIQGLVKTLSKQSQQIFSSNAEGFFCLSYQKQLELLLKLIENGTSEELEMDSMVVGQLLGKNYKTKESQVPDLKVYPMHYLEKGSRSRYGFVWSGYPGCHPAKYYYNKNLPLPVNGISFGYYGPSYPLRHPILNITGLPEKQFLSCVPQNVKTLIPKDNKGVYFSLSIIGPDVDLSYKTNPLCNIVCHGFCAPEYHPAATDFLQDVKIGVFEGQNIADGDVKGGCLNNGVSVSFHSGQDGDYCFSPNNAKIALKGSVSSGWFIVITAGNRVAVSFVVFINDEILASQIFNDVRDSNGNIVKLINNLDLDRRTQQEDGQLILLDLITILKKTLI